MKKKGELLIENVVFIILNLVFLAVLIVFVFLKTGDPAMVEEGYAKKIALMIDAAQPGMLLGVEMDDAFKVAEDEDWPKEEIVKIEDNVVRVQLREEGGYEYSFFNNVSPLVEIGNNKIEIKIQDE